MNGRDGRRCQQQRCRLRRYHHQCHRPSRRRGLRLHPMSQPTPPTGPTIGLQWTAVGGTRRAVLLPRRDDGHALPPPPPPMQLREHHRGRLT